jgi:hypothetical protein
VIELVTLSHRKRPSFLGTSWLPLRGEPSFLLTQNIAQTFCIVEQKCDGANGRHCPEGICSSGPEQPK